MNKRQRKKQRTRYIQQEAKFLQEFSTLIVDEQTCRMRLLLLPHRRRHWMSPTEYRQRKQALLAKLEVEKAALLEKMKTHDYTLGGWMPKRQK